MNTRTFGAGMRRATAISRRGSLRVMGVAALTTALGSDSVAQAGNTRKQGQKRCKRQEGQCAAVIKTLCKESEVFNACETSFLPCCKHFATCNARAGLECLTAASGEELTAPVNESCVRR